MDKDNEMENPIPTQLWYSYKHEMETQSCKHGRLTDGSVVAYSFSPNDKDYQPMPDMVMLGMGYDLNDIFKIKK